MKRMLMALASVAGLAAATGTARADWGGFAPPAGPQGGMPVPMATPAGFNAPGTLMGLGAPVPGRMPDQYGLLPALRKSSRGGECSTCGNRGLFGGSGLFGNRGGCGPVAGHSGWGSHGGNGGGYGYGPQYPPVMQGTLVFPNHTYVRSPRDFFMYEPGK